MNDKSQVSLEQHVCLVCGMTFQKGRSAQTRNSGTLQPPASPYEVMAGTVISAVLVTGIKSDLPGEVIATVTEPVYDTATGKYLLIPQGSRILGKYNSQVSYGQAGYRWSGIASSCWIHPR